MVAADAQRRPLTPEAPETRSWVCERNSGSQASTIAHFRRGRGAGRREPKPGRATKRNAGGGTRTPKGVSPPAPKAGA
jgi:hypothetical protein